MRDHAYLTLARDCWKRPYTVQSIEGGEGYVLWSRLNTVGISGYGRGYCIILSVELDTPTI
jgi:hypothetical protein